SIAQKKNRETEASGIGWELFCQYKRALDEAQPRWFIYENNKSMSQAIRQSISEAFGFGPVCINSALVSAQNRQRLYWVGVRQADGTYKQVHVDQPEDRGILLRDVLDGASVQKKSGALTASYYKAGSNPFSDFGSERHRERVFEPVNMTADGKAQCIRASCYKDGIRNLVANTVDRRTAVGEPVAVDLQVVGRRRNADGEWERSWEARTDGKSSTLTSIESRRMVAEPLCVAERGRYENGVVKQHFEARPDGKTNTLTTVQKDNNVAEPVRIGTYPSPDGTLRGGQGMRIYDHNAKSVTLCGNGGGKGAKTGLYAIPVAFDGEIPTHAVSGADGKTYPVFRVEGGIIVINGKAYPIKLPDGYWIIRKLTVSECKRLQTVPEWYEFPVSNTQAYKLLGNGWTVEVIAHLIRAIMEGERHEDR
ncbi:MAG: DNA cytosine methyltransferase, partial [Oscillospiraceae bacterium]|nr:DNA cytosine methyltransferase [Oscillospiraceae bacterium]